MTEQQVENTVKRYIKAIPVMLHKAQPMPAGLRACAEEHMEDLGEDALLSCFGIKKFVVLPATLTDNNVEEVSQLVTKVGSIFTSKQSDLLHDEANGKRAVRWYHSRKVQTSEYLDQSTVCEAMCKHACSVRRGCADIPCLSLPKVFVCELCLPGMHQHQCRGHAARSCVSGGLSINITMGLQNTLPQLRTSAGQPLEFSHRLEDLQLRDRHEVELRVCR